MHTWHAKVLAKYLCLKFQKLPKISAVEINIGTFGTLLPIEDVADLLDKICTTPFDVKILFQACNLQETAIVFGCCSVLLMGRLVRSALKRKPALVYKNVSDEMFKSYPSIQSSSLWKPKSLLQDIKLLPSPRLVKGTK